MDDPAGSPLHPVSILEASEGLPEIGDANFEFKTVVGSFQGGLRGALDSSAEQSTLRAAFKELAAREVVKVIVTKHALSRLTERRAKDYEKLDGFVLESIVANTVRDGRYRVGSKDVVVATRKYTLICAVEGGALVVKTVLRTDKERWERFSKAPRTPWKSVVVFLKPSKPP